MEHNKVAFIYDEKLMQQCNRLPAVLNRASIVQDLIESFQLLSDKNISVIKSTPATQDELKYCHSSYYLDFLQKTNDCVDLEVYEEEQVDYGLGYDCQLLENCYDLIKILGGASLTAAKLINNNYCNIAINWFGGWHHAQRDAAEGFCYVNDVVIAIQKLSEKFSKILYIDLDIHHGNGVQNAFQESKKVLTLSFHKLSPGFYPGSGTIDDIGGFNAKYYSLNVPFLDGVNNKTYLSVFKRIFLRVFNAYKPLVLVVQCGADGLNDDPIGQCNLTNDASKECVEIILNCELPTLFLGGGGYNFPNTARLWTTLTSIIAGIDIENDIPDNSKFFTMYGPTYELTVDQGCQKDYNTPVYIEKLVNTINDYCNHII